MKAEFLIENIEKFLPVFLKVLPVHSQVPILSNLLIEANKNGLFIYATNLEMGVQIKIPAKIEEEGAITVPGKQFVETLSSLPKDKVTLNIEKENLILSCRGSRISFQTIAKEEFPTLYEDKGKEIHSFKGEEFGKIFSNLMFAVSLDESRPALTGVLLSQKSNEVDFVATDGFRLSLRQIKGVNVLEPDEKLILPAKIINETLLVKDAAVIKMYVYEKNNQVIFETDEMTLVGRLINGDFPNYSRVIPNSGKTTINVDKEDFVQNIRLSSIFARDMANVVRVKIEGGKMKMLSKSSGLGEGEVVLEVEQEGEDNEIAFNAKFLGDFLKNISSKTVSMQVSSSVEPALFKTEDDKDFIHVIMPVRI